MITPSRKEYLLRLEDLSRQRHTSSYLASVIEEAINQVGIEKIVAIISDNASNVAGARRIITENHPRILNVRCVAHCINLICSDLAKINDIKYLTKCANIIVRYFKNSTLGSSWLKDAIELKNIQGGKLKSYVETRWTSLYECTHSIWRLKDALQHVR